MVPSFKISRRNMLKTHAGATAGAFAVSGMAGNPGPTPANGEGPFYPVHEKADKNVDLKLVQARAKRAVGKVCGA